jgi:hypothetical protein
MVDAGKIQAVHADVETQNGKYDPWIILPWSSPQQEEAIDTFNCLVDGIESRMPDTVHRLPSAARQALLSEADLDVAHIPLGFARSFLSRIKRPTFRYIAPGLSIPDAMSFASLPFSSFEGDPPDDQTQEAKVVFPILIFSSSEPFRAPETNGEDNKYGNRLPFGWPYSQVFSYPAGLYLTDADRGADNVSEDTVKLALPWGIGAQRFARTSDGARFGENKEAEEVEPKDVYAELYQPGYRPFVEMHYTQLVKVLESWIGMIERNDWKVGSEGVEGAISKFREADTELGWSKFVVPVSWWSPKDGSRGPVSAICSRRGLWDNPSY